MEEGNAKEKCEDFGGSTLRKVRAGKRGGEGRSSARPLCLSEEASFSSFSGSG